jgi:fructokinase
MSADSNELSNAAGTTIVGLGELIWDLLPSGKQLGGAPTNFAYMSRLLGNKSIVASRIGTDELGREALERLERCGISTEHIQLDATHPTGTVSVQIGQHGEPRFAMNEDSAWDYLEWTASYENLARQADAVCFGSFAQRHRQARETIIAFLKQTRRDTLRLFDVNLRHAFFTADLLNASLELANIVKLNLEELSTIASMLGLYESNEEALGRCLIKLFRLELVAITRGADGSLLISNDCTIQHAGFQIQVRDTIGAGDAFAAALAHCYLRRVPLKETSEAANQLASWVAMNEGATPEPAPGELEKILGHLANT